VDGDLLEKVIDAHGCGGVGELLHFGWRERGRGRRL